MLQRFLSDSPLTLWPLLAFFLFFVTFVTVCIRLVVGKLRNQDYEHVASLPLEDDAATGRGE